eukprot:TRINITY_DN4253_c0_g3_i1.p1 TRINITY_DN4253_c0_g3~~TRINITY_DN4253_c0_g3_i1.p1  ORF type:complete len:199 (+),score=-28.40 TRINITY_DN4253_c0_g3_i1:335-931(+)
MYTFRPVCIPRKFCQCTTYCQVQSRFLYYLFIFLQLICLVGAPQFVHLIIKEFTNIYKYCNFDKYDILKFIITFFQMDPHVINKKNQRQNQENQIVQNKNCQQILISFISCYLYQKRNTKTLIHTLCKRQSSSFVQIKQLIFQSYLVIYLYYRNIYMCHLDTQIVLHGYFQFCIKCIHACTYVIKERIPFNIQFQVIE